MQLQLTTFLLLAAFRAAGNIETIANFHFESFEPDAPGTFTLMAVDAINQYSGGHRYSEFAITNNTLDATVRGVFIYDTEFLLISRAKFGSDTGLSGPNFQPLLLPASIAAAMDVQAWFIAVGDTGIKPGQYWGLYNDSPSPAHVVDAIESGDMQIALDVVTADGREFTYMLAVPDAGSTVTLLALAFAPLAWRKRLSHSYSRQQP